MSAARATARTLAYLDRLLRERDHGGLLVPRTFQGLTQSAASDLIGQLEQRPIVQSRLPTEPRTINGCVAGIYEMAGDLYRLRPTRDGLGLYPQVRVEGRWEYAPEVQRRLLPQMRRRDLEATG